jgi:hypothetical protein
MSKEKLSEYFDAVVRKDENAAFEAYTQYIEQKGKSILKELMDEVKKPIRLKGNDVLVKGKKVGTINNKLEGEKEGEEGKIEYTCADTGKVSSHDKLANLFKALAKEHKLEESDLAHASGANDQVAKTTKAINDADPEKGLNLSKETGHEDHADHDDSKKQHSADEKRKNQSRKQTEKAIKSWRPIDWKK